MSDIQIYLDITFNKVGKSLSKIWSTRAIFLSYTEQSSFMFWHVDSRVMCLKMFCLWYEFNTPHEPNLPKADASLGKTVLVCTFSIGFSIDRPTLQIGIESRGNEISPQAVLAPVWHNDRLSISYDIIWHFLWKVYMARFIDGRRFRRSLQALISEIRERYSYRHYQQWNIERWKYGRPE